MCKIISIRKQSFSSGVVKSLHTQHSHMKPLMLFWGRWRKKKTLFFIHNNELHESNIITVTLCAI